MSWKMDLDSQQALFRAIQIEGAAMKKYVATLKVYTNLVAHGILPEEGASSDTPKPK